MEQPRRSTAAGTERTLSQGDASARGLLLTLLGEFVLPDGGSVWTSTFVHALSDLGVEPKTTRQALARTAKSARILEPERLGRRTRWSLTTRGIALLEEGAERIYNFGVREEPWNDEWLIVIASVPEADRHLRYRLRTRLAWVGFAPIGPGVWLSPWVSHEPSALEALSGLGLEASAIAFIGQPSSLRNAIERVHEAWELGELRNSYDEFIREIAVGTPPTDDRDAFLSLTRVVHTWRHFPIADPGLPSVLLPADWNGRRAASAFHVYHERWRPAAQRHWEAISRLNDES